MSLYFVTGPVRSGKSRFAMDIAKRLNLPVTYVATGARIPADADWSGRIERHRFERPKDWKTVETAGDLDSIRIALANPDRNSTVIVDSVGTWLADRLFQLPDRASTTELLEQLVRCGEYFIEAAGFARANVIAVSEETGWSVHPEFASGRVFRDALGFTNQRLARLAKESYLVVSGYALDLKSAIPVGDIQ